MAKKKKKPTQHQIDNTEGVSHHRAAGVDGGKCLSRHVGKIPRRGKDNSCSHRWQAYKNMEDYQWLYNWDVYENLTNSDEPLKTAQTKANSKKMYPSWYTATLQTPAKFEWDWGKKSKYKKRYFENFYEKCYIPYWHEAHHIVPNGRLMNAIAMVDNGKYTYVIRGGLAEEEYNLNHKDNMIMLPMDISVANGLSLPRHRRTALLRNHSGYDKQISTKLNSIFSGMAKDWDKHEAQNYKNIKNDIVTLSKNMHAKIRTSVSESLDDMGDSEFEDIVTEF